MSSGKIHVLLVFVFVFINFVFCTEESVTPVPVDKEPALTGLENEFREIAGDGGYEFKYATSDGAVREEVGEVKHSYINVRGKYEFIGEDGEKYVINYVADEKGFRPQGAHIPV